MSKLLDAMTGDPIAPEQNVLSLRQELAEHFQEDSLTCESMGALVRENLRQVRLDDEQARAAHGAA